MAGALLCGSFLHYEGILLNSLQKSISRNPLSWSVCNEMHLMSLHTPWFSVLLYVELIMLQYSVIKESTLVHTWSENVLCSVDREVLVPCTVRSFRKRDFVGCKIMLSRMWNCDLKGLVDIASTSHKPLEMHHVGSCIDTELFFFSSFQGRMEYSKTGNGKLREHKILHWYYQSSLRLHEWNWWMKDKSWLICRREVRSFLHYMHKCTLVKWVWVKVLEVLEWFGSSVPLASDLCSIKNDFKVLFVLSNFTVLAHSQRVVFGCSRQLNFIGPCMFLMRWWRQKTKNNIGLTFTSWTETQL